MLVLDGGKAAIAQPNKDSAAPVGSPLKRSRQLSARLMTLAGDNDRAARLSPETFQALLDSRLALSVFPERHGGEGLLASSRTHELAQVLRQVGAGDLSVGRIFEGHVNAVALVERFGTQAQLEAFAQAVRQGALSGVWNAEGRRPLTATRTDFGWCLHGEKILASGAGLLSHPIVTPKTGEGVVMFLLDLGLGAPADLSAWTPLGMRATATGTVDLTDFAAPRDTQIGAAGDYLRQPAFSGGAWRFCAVHLGAAERLLDLFRAQLVARGRQQDPYQKQRIALGVAAATTAAFWIDRAAALVASGDADAEETVAFVNLTRTVTERACLDVLELVQRGVGLGAFMRPDPIERIARDLSTYLRQPVPDAAMADAAGTVLASGKSTFDLWSLDA